MSPDKRHAILDAARARFYHYGIRKTTMQEVARDAGLAVGTLYLYFEDKDDLVVACAEEFAGHHRAQAEAILASRAAPNKKLRKYLLARYAICKEIGTGSRHASELAREVIRLKPDRLADEAAIMERTILACLEEGVRSGAFHIPDPARDARVLLISVAYFFPNATMTIDRWPPETGLKMLLDWFIETWSKRT